MLARKILSSFLRRSNHHATTRCFSGAAQRRVDSILSEMEDKIPAVKRAAPHFIQRDPKLDTESKEDYDPEITPSMYFFFPPPDCFLTNHSKLKFQICIMLTYKVEYKSEKATKIRRNRCGC